jgi:hypothetical protein
MEVIVPSPDRDRPVVSFDSFSDDQLLGALSMALQELDPVPAALVDDAKATFTWRTVDAELAELIGDTALEAASVRGFGAPRILTFAAGDTTLMLEVAEHNDKRRLLGQIVAPRSAEIEVDHVSGGVTVAADHLGRFRVEEFPGGPIRLSLRFPDDPSRVVTSWVSV